MRYSDSNIVLFGEKLIINYLFPKKDDSSSHSKSINHLQRLINYHKTIPLY